MTHKFADYLQREFGAGWHVDCEYNRQYGRNGIRTPKELDWMLEVAARPDDDRAKTVYPDIIVHRRGTENNLLIIEAKKSGGTDAQDRAKLVAFTDAPFHYSYGVLLRFITVAPFDVRFERYPQ